MADPTANLKSLDWDKVKAHLASLASSEAGSTQLSQLSQLSSTKEARESFKEIEEFLALLPLHARPQMTSLDLCPSWLSRLEKQATLKILELKDVRLFCIEALEMKQALQSVKELGIFDLNENLINGQEPLSAIEQIMTPSGEIRTDASERLFKLFNEKKSLEKQIEKTLDRLVKENDFETVLQDRYVTNREGRWVIPVKSGRQHDFSGIIHGSSHSKQTVFMEPQIVTPMNNRLRQVEVEIQDEINRLLKQLSDYLYSRLDEFKTTQKTLLRCDIRLAQAQLSDRLNAHRVDFSAIEIHLREVRHPLLALDTTKVISNSVHICNEQNVLLLSGPNAGGKTVLLKSIGLAAQMARCGLLVCAEKNSTLPFFRNIQAAVGDEQSVDQHLSTFAAHLKSLNEGTRLQGSENLLLIDEICGSTDPEEGSALARSFIEAYADNGIFSIVTSHLGPLKANWPQGSRVVSGSLEYNKETGLPTYQFIFGVPGHSQALQTAKRIGVSEKILERAMSILSPETKKRLEGLQEIDSLRDQLHTLQAQFKLETEQARRQKEKFKNWLKKFQEEKAEKVHQIAIRAERRFEQMIKTEKVKDVFLKHEQNSRIVKDFPKVIKAKAETAITDPKAFEKTYPPGSRVWVSTVGQNGIVQSGVNNKGEVTIQAASMRLQVPWKSLQTAKAGSGGSSAKRKTLQTQIDADPIVDLRGKTIDEAIEILEVQLDRAVDRENDRIKIIHGHGTNALKKAVRAHLSRSLLVQNWSAGDPEFGGDGITWVEL